MSLPKSMPTEILDLIFHDTQTFTDNMYIKNNRKILWRFENSVDSDFNIDNIHDFLD